VSGSRDRCTVGDNQRERADRRLRASHAAHHHDAQRAGQRVWREWYPSGLFRVQEVGGVLDQARRDQVTRGACT
jgi:hypothetical protein